MLLKRHVQYVGDEGDVFRSRNEYLIRHSVRNTSPVITVLRQELNQKRTYTRPPGKSRTVNFMEVEVSVQTITKLNNQGETLLAFAQSDQAAIATTVLLSTTDCLHGKRSGANPIYTTPSRFGAPVVFLTSREKGEKLQQSDQ